MTTRPGRTGARSPPRRSPSASAARSTPRRSRRARVPSTPRAFFADAAGYDGPYTGDDPALRGRGTGISVDGQDVTIIEMSTAVPRHGLLRRRHGDGPGAAWATPPTRRATGSDPLATGPYEVESWEPARGAGPGRATRRGSAALRPRPPPVRRSSSCSSSTRTRPRSTRSCSSDGARSRDRRCRRPWARIATATPIDRLGDRLVQQPSQCVDHADPGLHARSPTSGSARRSPTPTPTRTCGSPAARSPV